MYLLVSNRAAAELRLAANCQLAEPAIIAINPEPLLHVTVTLLWRPHRHILPRAAAAAGVGRGHLADNNNYFR